MKSAKTLHLIEMYLALRASGKRIAVFRSSKDLREPCHQIASRYVQVDPVVSAVHVENSAELVERLPHDTQVLLIDEAQFFDRELPDRLVPLRQRLEIGISGLDMDFRGLPFEPMPALMAMADVVHKHVAVCDRCKVAQARFTQRLRNGLPAMATESDIEIENDGQSQYEARCEEHFMAPPDLDEWLVQRADARKSQERFRPPQEAR